jgi:ribosomal protein S6--L-glutamate ligase
MILSFHPCFESDKNILCAGRNPNAADLSAIRQADAVILPQGCKKELFQIARDHCKHVFPNYDARFRFPGKIGQIDLFQQTGVPHPKTLLFQNIDDYNRKFGNRKNHSGISYPCVFKFDWGGEGESVFLIHTVSDMENLIQKAEKFEAAGLKGFLIQEYISCDNRSLRVAVIGETYGSYWRIQKNKEGFGASVAKGSYIDFQQDPELQKKAIHATRKFCNITGINLAGFDFLFPSNEKEPLPFFLEINYFFGRRGLGGSEVFYQVLNREIQSWIVSLDLSHSKKES